MTASRWILAATCVQTMLSAIAVSQGRQVAAPATASIRGSVVDRESRSPLRRAIVTVSGSALEVAQSAITDDDGRFGIDALPAGQYKITATKSAFVSGSYGAVKPGREGTPAVIAVGQALAVTVELSRAAVLTGTIRDESGLAVPGLLVRAYSPARPEVLGLSMVPGLTALSDDRGTYRLFNLPPGEYLIVATTNDFRLGDAGRPGRVELDAEFARLRQRSGAGSQAPAAPTTAPKSYMIAPVYFPGSSTVPSATKVKVGVGEVRSGLDFVVQAVPMTTITGVIVAGGGLPRSVELSIAALDRLDMAGAALQPRLTQTPAADGRFTYQSVAPGRYRVTARGTGATPPSGRGVPPPVMSTNQASTDILYGIEEVDVRGEPAFVTIQLMRGPRFEGRVVFQSDSRPAPSPSNVQVTLRSTGGGVFDANGRMVGSFGIVGPFTLKPDGSFQVVGLPPNDYTVGVTLTQSPNDWWLRSVMLEGRDLLDTGVTLSAGKDIDGAIVTLTDRRPGLSGTLATSAGAAAPDHFVIVMSSNPEWRASGSRRLRFTRPATDGHFTFEDLPPGDYLLAALTDLDPNEWQTTEFLSGIAPSAVRVTIGEGERKVQDLRIR